MPITEEQEKTIRQVAAYLSAGRPAYIRELLAAAMLDLAGHYPASGGLSLQYWLASMQQLGEVCLSIAKAEKAKHK